MRKNYSRAMFLLMLLLQILPACNNKKNTTNLPEYNDALVQKIRTAATAVPGELPISISYLKYAASIRKWKAVIEGGSDDACTMARTAFQIEYGQGYVMVDAGMDRAVHHFFEKNGPQPFDDAKATLLATSIQQAKLILITHEHGDDSVSCDGSGGFDRDRDRAGHVSQITDGRWPNALSGVRAGSYLDDRFRLACGRAAPGGIGAAVENRGGLAG